MKKQELIDMEFLGKTVESAKDMVREDKKREKAAKENMVWMKKHNLTAKDMSGCMH